jgi:hypothetical protein
MGDINRKIADYENRIGLMAQENQKLNDALRQNNADSQNKINIFARK